VADFVKSTLIADLALLVLAIEAVLVLLGARHLGTRGRSAYLANVAAGAGLMLAFRALAGGAGWPMTAGAFLIALGGHLADLYFRLRTSSEC
jgi:hypothetical protein